MEPYEEFYGRHLARLQGQTVHSDPLDPPRVSVIHFHGVAVLSPLLTEEKRQEMQQYRQRAIELHDKRQSNKKKSLLNRVQEILDTVQVKTLPSVLPNTESTTIEQNSELKSMNGFAILPNAINFPVFAGQNGPARFEKSVENLIYGHDKSIKTTEAKECLDCKPQVECRNPTLKDHSTDGTINSATPEESQAATKDPPDPYVMSLQNLLKKSREYIERGQIRRSLKSISKESSVESHSDKENDAIKISDSLKDKARLANRSRSCSPLLADKPTLNKSNSLLQAASIHSSKSSSNVLPSSSRLDIALRQETSSGADTESDEELKKACVLGCDSSLIKSLTGSYAKLPSPEPSLSPKMHRRRPRPLSAGNIVINHPVNAYDLSPNVKGNLKEQRQPEANERTLSYVPSCEGTSGGLLFRKRHSLEENVGLDSSLNMPSRYNPVGSKTDHDKRVNERAVTDAPHTILSRGAPITNISECSMLTHHVDLPATNASTVQKPYVPLEIKHHSPAELNKSYDVETPSPFLLQSQSTNQATDISNVYSTREQCLDNNLDVEVKRRLEPDLESTRREMSPPSMEEEKRWSYEHRGRSASLHIPKQEVSPNSAFEDSLKKKMLAFEEMRKKLEEQHAYQLSLLIAEQEREQERLQREFEDEEQRLRFKDSVDRAVSGDGYRPKPDWSHNSDRSIHESIASHLENSHAGNTSFGSVIAPSQHSYGSTNDAPYSLWGQAEMRTPKISASRPMGRAKTRWSQVYSPQMQRKFNKVTAVAKGFLTRRLMQTEKMKHLKQTVKDTAEFIRTFQSDVPQNRGIVTSQDVSLQERVIAQLRAALYEIHDIFFTMDAAERMTILAHDRELRREKMIRQLEKLKSPRDRVTLSSATQKSLDRKKLTRAVEIGMSNRKPIPKPKSAETRVLQPSQGQNAPINKLLCRQGSICKKNLKKEAKCCDNLRRQHSLG
ncbi:centriolar coiled-coil protein of 110 kDa [Gastrophryne carolinensis]